MDDIFGERLRRSLKYRGVHLRENTAPREVCDTVMNYLHFYDYQRKHQALGYRTPAEVYNAEVKRRGSCRPSDGTDSGVLISAATTSSRVALDEAGNEQPNQDNSI